MKYALYNTAHPLAESGKPIFIPFGEWPYDEKSRQRLDRAHGEAIANELNARVANGEPGIPIYQGHPDVPALAARYPDKGALGWVTKIALANENGKDGLALTVEWDRDPGKGFKWFSPYWFANEKKRDGQTYIVADIRSIGLVNRPNIPEFRLANELQDGLNNNERTFAMPQHLIDLAKRFDDRMAALANEYDESKHPRDEDGKWTSTGGGGSAMPKSVNVHHAQIFSRKAGGMQSRREQADYINGVLRNERKNMKEVGSGLRTGGYTRGEHKDQRKDLRAVHVAAIMSGLTYNRDTHQYE